MPNIISEAKIDLEIDRLSNGSVYRVSPYHGSRHVLTVSCLCGRVWSGKYGHLRLNKFGCRRCNELQTVSIAGAKYQQALNVKYRGKIVCTSIYLGNKVKIEHNCRDHGKFITSPNNTLYGRGGCRSCARHNLTNRDDKRRLSQNQATALVFSKHGSKVQLLSPYTRWKKKHDFGCDQGHHWQAVFAQVALMSGCPYCNSPRVASRASLEWIEAVSRHLHLEFEHANKHNRNSTGESRLRGISGKLYYVDGYNEQNKIVLEFHGDCWHGNPTKYAPSSYPNPFSKLTAWQLFIATIKRMRDLKAAGYTVLYVWESDWYAGQLFSRLDTNLFGPPTNHVPELQD